MKTKVFSFLKFNVFRFGTQKVSQFVVFECKYLFSIIFFYFHETQGVQDRFHTHAFNAVSIKLFGNYDEYLLQNETSGEFSIEKRTKVFKYFPRNSYHKIGKSNGCMTVLFSGPWKKTWKEYINGDVVHYSWGREK